MPAMRALAAVRLSNDTDESTSVERQTEATMYTVKARGDRLVQTVVDTDVSGAVSPFERPNLGPWLTDADKIAQWDYLIVAKIDRLSRSILDWQVFLKWCDANNKTVVSVSEGFDLSSQWGRLSANMLMMFAEFERMRIGERRKEAAEKLRASGRWNGGVLPYGYRQSCVCHGKPECKEATGWNLSQSAEALVVRRAVNDVIDGMSLSAIARYLNDEGVSTPQGAAEWRSQTLTSILRSRYLRGELQYKGHTVRDADGNPVLITDEPIITEAEWELLQQALKTMSKPHKGQRETNHLLIRIAYCGECDALMYFHRNAYRCWNKKEPHGMPYIAADALEGAVEDFLLREYGEDQIMRRAANGTDYASELERTTQELAELEEQYIAHNLSAERFASMSTKMERRIAELRVLADSMPAERWEPTGETVAGRWNAADVAGKRAMLMRLGIRWHVRRAYRIDDHAWQFRIESSWLPVEESHERLARDV